MTNTPDDSPAIALTPADVETIGRTVYGREDYRGAMAFDLGCSRAYAAKMAANGCDGVQASSMIGLISRRILLEQAREVERRAAVEVRAAELAELYETFNPDPRP